MHRAHGTAIDVSIRGEHKQDLGDDLEQADNDSMGDEDADQTDTDRKSSSDKKSGRKRVMNPFSSHGMPSAAAGTRPSTLALSSSMI